LTLVVNLLELNEVAVDPVGAADGTIWYNSTDQEVRVRQGGFTVPVGGISVPQHEALDQLVHVIAESGVVEDAFNADGCLTAREIRTAASPGGFAIRRWDQFTFDADGCLAGYRLQQFGPTGLVVQTLTVSRPGGVWTTVLS